MIDPRMGLLVNSSNTLSSSYSRPYCFGQKSTTTTNRIKGGRFKRKEKCSLLKQLLIKANLKRQHKKFFLGRGDDDDDKNGPHKKKKTSSPLSPVSPHALDDHEFYVLHNFQFPLQQQQPVLQQQQQRRLSDAGTNASSRSTSSSSRSSSSWPSVGSSIAGIYGSYIGSSPEASSLSPLSSVAQLSPLSSVDSVLQNGSIITHPPSNETISSLGDNEAVDATYSPEGTVSSSTSNVSPHNYNLRPKTPPTPGHLLVAFRASQPSSPSPSPQQQQQQQQQMGSPVNIPMAVRPIPIQVQRGQFRPSSTAQEIIAATSGASGVGGLVLLLWVQQQQDQQQLNK